MQREQPQKENILERIVGQRKADIARQGYSFGCHIPERRTRKIVPFMARRGTILEIKRASPSRGPIAALPDPAATARTYAAAGANAVSVLTERNWFKGSLDDLICVADAVPETAVLRKDFLLDEEEISIAFRCGADAVLLIARILETEKLVSMTRTCAELGITAFIEVRLQSDINKLQQALDAAPGKVVAGVNSRDLRDFSIDPLQPLQLLPQLPDRVVYESGIRTESAAAFAAKLGFHGMLLGEAAARDPDQASQLVKAFMTAEGTRTGRFWKKLIQKKHPGRPLVKICGLTKISDAVEAARYGADLLGFIFSSESSRCVTSDFVCKAAEALKTDGTQSDQPLRIGVITDPESAEAKDAYRLVQSGTLDALQFHNCIPSETEAAEGTEDTADIPGYAAVTLETEQDLVTFDHMLISGQPRILIDARKTGTVGHCIDEPLIRKTAGKTKLWLAGGITPENIVNLVQTFHPELIDCASGIEQKPGIKDIQKMKKLFEILNSGGRYGA